MFQVSRSLPAHATLITWLGANKGLIQGLPRHPQGLQYEHVNLGPPKPPCNEARLATLKALECTDIPSDPELGERIQGASCLCSSDLPSRLLHSILTQQ